MNHRGKRSIPSTHRRLQKQTACKFIMQNAYFDRQKGEAVTPKNFTVNEVAYHIALTTGETPEPECIPNIEPGLVLNDAYGAGFLQQPDSGAN